MRDSLTGRERKIIEMIVEGQGASNKVLAGKLFISEHTLRNHLTSIYNKLDVGNRLELYVYAVKHQMGRVPQARTEHS
jgi:DNA-binding CsgD family transcriptional regulator